jgi:hypothetical protein
MARLKRLSHELFAREYVRNGGNSKEAYVKVWEFYPKKAEILPQSFKVIGWDIKRRPEVRRRIEELRDRMAKRADITEDKILSNYEEAITMARAQAKPNDLTNAATAQAKLVGLLRDRVDISDTTDVAQMEDANEILNAVAARKGRTAALELARHFGITDWQPANVEPLQEVPEPDADGLLIQKAASDAVN